MENKRYVNRDQEILLLLRQKPEEGFRLLFDVYHMQLCVYVVQLTDSFSLAEDIVQDFFMTFFEKKYYRQINENLRIYLYTSIRHATMVALKKKKLLSMEEITNIPAETPFEIDLKQEELEEREAELMKKLNSLPKQEFAAIRTVILENKKYVEAAEELHISINTLKTHLSRALKRLRKEYNLSFLFYINTY